MFKEPNINFHATVVFNVIVYSYYPVGRKSNDQFN